MKEIDLKITELNAEKPVKGRKFGHEWEAKYTSTARTVLRNMWLLDFVSLLFDNLNKDRTSKLSDVAKDAYSKTLGNHHPWIVRQAAKVAMLGVPSRDALILSTKLKYEHCEDITKNVDIIRMILWEDFKKLKLDNLP